MSWMVWKFPNRPATSENCTGFHRQTPVITIRIPTKNDAEVEHFLQGVVDGQILVLQAQAQRFANCREHLA